MKITTRILIPVAAVIMLGISGSFTSLARATETDTDARADARYRDVVVPAGTILPITLDSYVASDSSRIEDPVRAHLRRSIVVDGWTAIPAGSPISGHVTSVRRPGRVKGLGYVAFRFDRLSVASTGEHFAIATSAVGRQAPATKKVDAAKIGVPAAGGAIIGAITGGKKGAAIGAAAGGGAGTALVLSTRGREVRLGRGAIASVRLLEPIVVRVRE